MSDNNFDDDKLSGLSDDEYSEALDQPPVNPGEAPGKSGKQNRANYSASRQRELEERDFKPVRAKRTGKTGLFGGVMYFVFIVSISIILACLGWMAASDVLALNKAEISVEVTLPEELFTLAQRDVKDKDGNVTGTKDYYISDIDGIARILKDAGIIEYKPLFKFYSSISDANVQIDPGTYTLSTLFDYRAIIKKMQFGSESQVKSKITFPEGFSMMQIFERLEENNICRVSDLLQAAAKTEYGYKFLENVPYGDASRLEGFLFPDTYDFYPGMGASTAIDTFLLNFHNKLTKETWDKAEARGLTMSQLVNIASMIEKETSGSVEDRQNIASVIYNRMKANMALGIDATSIYSHQDYEGDVKTMINTWVADTTDPYNTRHNMGLPPTAIANPGSASISAALNPANTNYLYYALDEATKTHKFFKDAGSFNAFVATQNYDD